MNRFLTLTAAVCLAALAGVPVATAHNYLVQTEAPAGFVHDIAMRVPHGCQGSPVNSVRIKIPQDVYRVTVEHRTDWNVELKMREVDPPVPGDGGRPITETVAIAKKIEMIAITIGIQAEPAARNTSNRMISAIPTPIVSPVRRSFSETS